jgi:hypothetical protein
LNLNGRSWGRQFVTFDKGQAYPEFVIDLRRNA